LSPSPDTPFPKEFGDDQEFLRGINPLHYDPARGKVASAAFSNTSNTNRMSVLWTGRATIDDLVSARPGWGAALLTAMACRQEHQSIEASPTPRLPSHCDIVGEKPERVRKRLRDASKLLKAPAPPDSAS
jgi:hypothetical protein